MKQNHALFLIGIVSVGVLSGISGCSTWNPYRPEIHQGNIVSAEAIGRLKVGMNSTQVQAILGTPVTSDFFQAQRWDYLHYASRNGSKLVLRRLSLWFENNQLSRWDSEGLPEASSATPAPSTPSPSSTSPEITPKAAPTSQEP